MKKTATQIRVEKIIKEIVKTYGEFTKIEKSRNALHKSEIKLIKKLLTSIKRLPKDSQPTKKELNSLKTAINNNLRNQISKINELF